MSVAPLDILLVAGFFPPHAPLAATRAPALARFLGQRGHRVRVLAARNADFPPVMDHGLPEGSVTWAEVAPPLSARALLRDPAGAARVLRRPADGLRRLTGWPDQQSGWLPDAARHGDALIAARRPDVILATAPPHSGLLVAEGLHRRHSVPWVAEFRDLWTGHPYYDGTGVRAWLDGRTEARVLGSAAGLATVTDGWRRQLSAQWPQTPVCLARNGFDPAEIAAAPPPAGAADPAHLTIIYAGVLYGDKRDPRPLFAAIARLPHEQRARVRVHFYGSERATVEAMAAEHGLAAPVVSVHDPVPRATLLGLQKAADVLLLLRWNDRREDHVLAGKLFEYIGCRRPILSVGSTTGEAADILRDGGLGRVSDDPAAIAAHLSAWLEEKAATERVAAPPEDASADHARGAQFEALEALLGRCAGKASPARTAAPATSSPVAGAPPRSA
ncbi:glycosyltransferase [Caenispirillum salinarum]|uniref:glycosyltransferase n=1 Tax=Caenispirillum salinarum TaxID=859058 RepID=UPI00384FC513